MWPKHAWFTLVREARSRRFSAALPAIARENPLRLAKLLKRKDRRLAERVGFEPTCRLPDKTLSRRSRYDHFGTSPQPLSLTNEHSPRPPANVRQPQTRVEPGDTAYTLAPVRLSAPPGSSSAACSCSFSLQPSHPRFSRKNVRMRCRHSPASTPDTIVIL